MEERQYCISARQLQRMIILETGSVGCLFVTFWSGGNNGLPIVMLSVIGSLFYGGLLMAIGKAGGGFPEMTEQNMSGFLWRTVWCIYIVRFVIRGAWILAYMEELIHETLYPGNRYMILIPLLLVCGYASVRSLLGRARFVELLFWWVIVPLVLLFLTGIWKLDLRELAPTEPINSREIFRGEYRLMVLFLPLEFLLFRITAMGENRKQAWIAGFRGILLAGAWMLLVYTVTVGIIGKVWSGQAILGVTDAMELISVRSGGLERLDVLMILFWLVGGMITLSAYIFQGQQLIRRIIWTQCKRSTSVLLMLGFIFAVYYCLNGAEAWSAWYWNYACYIDFPVSIILPVLIWINYKIRQRGKDSKIWKHTGVFSLLILCWICLGGCMKRDAIEDRVYVMELHVTETEISNEYEYRCMISYTGEEGSDKDQKNEEGIVVYRSGEGIKAVNDRFEQETDTCLDYSHLQGIYLQDTIYHLQTADKILNNIWQETQVVLSTPVYQEELDAGVQADRNLGGWLKEAWEE